MDYPGLEPLFGQQCIAVIGNRSFVGTLQPVANSKATVAMRKLPDDVASRYDFAINGVAALDVGAITFVQRLADYSQ
ncbi:MAG TPA: hypothetical protein VE826_01170 [Dongiaceae bacterium]|nr:hypothetical protein [Dongiaceae bacterium]